MEVIGIIIGLAFLAFWVWMVFDAATSPIDKKVLWILVVVFIPLGAVIYYFLGRGKTAAAA